MIRNRFPGFLALIAVASLPLAMGCGETALPTQNPPPGPGPGPGPGAPPELPPADPTTVLIVDDVDSENGGTSESNFTDFDFWTVIEGCVDLHGPGGVDPVPGNGLYIDMDGTCNNAGTLESKETFELHPADWRLEMIVAGNSQVTDTDSMLITVGTGNQWMMTLDDTASFQQIDYNFTLADSASATIMLEHYGSDEQGILIDAVRLRYIE